MAIDKTGKWWKGSSAADIDAYLVELNEGGYLPDRFVHPACACGADRFRVEADAEEGVARRTCVACGRAHVMLDSEEYLDEASPEPITCPCGRDVFELSVGFAHRTGGAVGWVMVGTRCCSCGVLGACADWKVDYEPTDHLYGRA